MATMNGVDVSHHQAVGSVNFTDYQFAIIKATEGKTYVDPVFQQHAANAMAAGCRIGFYHYARPENNTAPQEANNFLLQVKKFMGFTSGKFDKPCVLALDWEGNALSQDPVWISDWCKIVYDNSGVRPFVYFSDSQYDALKNYVPPECYYWIARWPTVPGAIKELSEKGIPCMHQWSGSPLDMDTFYGTAEQWDSIANGAPGGAPTPGEDIPSITPGSFEIVLKDGIEQINSICMSLLKAIDISRGNFKKGGDSSGSDQ